MKNTIFKSVIDLATIALPIGVIGLIFYFLQIKEPRFTVWVLKDHEKILINGTPLEELEIYMPRRPYRASYRDYSDSQSYKVTIERNGKLIFEDSLAPGSYLINSTERSWISAQVVEYGTMLSNSNPYKTHHSGLLIPPSPFGVYKLDSSASYYAVIDFNEEPHGSIKSQGSGSRRDFLKLSTGKIGSEDSQD